MRECSHLYDIERKPWSSEKTSETCNTKQSAQGHRAINILYGINMWYVTNAIQHSQKAKLTGHLAALGSSSSSRIRSRSCSRSSGVVVVVAFITSCAISMPDVLHMLRVKENNCR
jgi:hypothetical protein